MLVLVEERDERRTKARVRLVDELLARVLAALHRNRLADQRDDVRAARERQARGAPEEAQGGARLAGELSGAGEGEELGGAEVVDRDEVWRVGILVCGRVFFIFEVRKKEVSVSLFVATTADSPPPLLLLSSPSPYLSRPGSPP